MWIDIPYSPLMLLQTSLLKGLRMSFHSLFFFLQYLFVVDSSSSLHHHDLLNFRDAFLQLFVMVEENRYDDRMKWYQLNRARAG
jgi:hypothetical protein